MKATGIIRRIDDLGRVVVPKEIRRTLKIREGDPLEIYTDREGEVIGAVVMMARDENAKISESDIKLVGVAASFLGKQMET